MAQISRAVRVWMRLPWLVRAECANCVQCRAYIFLKECVPDKKCNVSLRVVIGRWEIRRAAVLRACASRRLTRSSGKQEPRIRSPYRMRLEMTASCVALRMDISKPHDVCETLARMPCRTRAFEISPSMCASKVKWRSNVIPRIFMPSVRGTGKRSCALGRRKGGKTEEEKKEGRRKKEKRKEGK